MKNKLKINIILILLCLAIVVAPLLLIRDSEFAGADGQAEEVIGELHEGYEPWVDPILEPPGGETESLLFALQAALGAGVIFYGVGYFKGKAKAAQ